MARALRILVAGGWYHVLARGNNRQVLFREDRDRQRFLSLVAELPERFTLELHAFVLMANHYHLLVRTLEANLSQAMRWLNISYSRWFNWRHRRVGHVFQGRFKGVMIQDERGVGEVARYVHLNPVRVQGLGLDKGAVRRQRSAAAHDPGAALVAERLQTLSQYRWSSWPVYAGAQPAPRWLETQAVARGCGGRTPAAQREALRAYTEAPIREGHVESPWRRLHGGLVLGEAEFARGLLRGRSVSLAEQTAARQLRARMDWARIVAATEAARGKPWAILLQEHKEWGRDGALYVAVRHGGHRLVAVAQRIPGLGYQAAAQAIRRFGATLAQDPARSRFVDRLRKQLSKI